MGYRKIYIAIDCRNEEEARQVQKVAEDLSTMFGLSARDIINVYPSVQKNAGLIKNVTKTLMRDGFKGLGKVVTYMISNFKK